MMLRSRRLEVVLALEQRREDAALEQMNRARGQLQAQQQRLDQLHDYQAEYRNQMRNSQQGVVPVSRLQGWQAFIAQLEQVIQQQQRQVRTASEQFDQARQHWRDAYERRRGMARHIEACRNQEQREQDLREQKVQDEDAGRAFARQRRGPGGS